MNNRQKNAQPTHRTYGDKKIVFFSYFPVKNLHKGKDMGNIIEHFTKVFHYETYVITPKTEKLTGWESKIIQVNNKFFGFIKNIVYIKPDVLVMYHCRLEALFYSIVFKIINPKGKIYIKMDSDLRNPYGQKHYNDKKGFSWKLKFGMKALLLLAKISTENRQDYKKFQQDGIDVFHIPNGIDPTLIDNSNIKKENIIFTVGRLGSYQKNTQEFLEIAKIVLKKDTSFRAVLAGSIEDETNFKAFLDQFYIENPDIKSRIIFTGYLDQKEVFQYYKKSKYCVITSRFEGFSLVFAEAAYFGCIIISRDVGGVRDITDDGRFGLIYKDISEIYPFITHQHINLEQLITYISNNFTWEKCIHHIHRELFGQE